MLYFQRAVVKANGDVELVNRRDDGREEIRTIPRQIAEAILLAMAQSNPGPPIKLPGVHPAEGFALRATPTDLAFEFEYDGGKQVVFLIPAGHRTPDEIEQVAKATMLALAPLAPPVH